jgi:hypothetical protein
MSRKSAIGLFAAIVILAIGGLLFRYALPGLSSARPTPPTVEIAVATWLLLHSVPAADAERVNPLSPTEAGLAAEQRSARTSIRVRRLYARPSRP